MAVVAGRAARRRAGRLTAVVGTVLFMMRLYIKAQMEYRGAFFIDRLAQIVNYGAGYATVWLLLHNFGALGGWEWPEFALLVGFQLFAYALGAAVSFVQMRELEDLVHRGQFDVLLVKPFSPWVTIVFRQFNIHYLGHWILAAGLIAWALTQVEVAWTFGGAVHFALSMVSAAMVVAALMTMIGATTFVLVKSNYLFPIFFGFFELVRYPITIYPAGLQSVLYTVVPLAFMNFVPVAWLLGKPIPLLGAWAGVLALIVGPVFALLAAAFWRWSVRQYQGAGG
jgi:ABC-2 type transport system permease protein